MSEPKPISKQDVLQVLGKLHRHLEIAHSGVVVAAAALRYQNAERDEEVARVLMQCVCERIAAQLERMAELMASLKALPADLSNVESWDGQRGGVGEAIRCWPQSASGRERGATNRDATGLAYVGPRRVARTVAG